MITRQQLSSLSPLLIALLASGCANASESTTTPAAADATSGAGAPSFGPAPSDGVVHDKAPCAPLAEYLTRLAGDGAIDCGTVMPDADPTAAWTCVDAAQRDGKPFKVALLKRGKDSTLATAWTRDAFSVVTRVSSDSDPGGSNDDKPAHGTKVCPQANLRSKDEGLQHGELFECAATTEPEHRCFSHGFEGQ